MQKTLRSYKQAYFALVVVVAGGLLAAGLVFAQDTATTAVTVGNAAPSVDAIDKYGSDTITLTENSSVTVTAKVTVSDSNGVGTESSGACSSLSSVDAKLYRDTLAGSYGTTCSQDDNNCYVGTCTATTTGNSCTGGSDTSVDYDCTFTVWYVADPTAAGQAFASDNWIIAATTTDTSAAAGTATNTLEALEVNGLLAHSVTASISYGTLSPGQDSRTDGPAANQVTTVTNTGNTPLDSQIGGDNMCNGAYSASCSTNTISESQQKFDLVNQATYAALTNTLAASATPATIETALAKPTATTSSVTDDLYWAIQIPGGQVSGTYNGLNEFTPVAD